MADVSDIVAALAERADTPNHRDLAHALQRRHRGHRHTLHELREHLFGDLEDPADDPQLGEPLPWA